MNKRILFLSLAVLMMMAPGCKKSNDEPYKEEETEETPIAVKSVTIQGAPTEAMYVGDRVTLTVQITPADATNQKVTWDTTNENVATVDAAGEVLAYGVGECEISATVDGVTAKVPITVISRSESRNACSDQMGHVGASKTDKGRNNQSVRGQFGESGWHYEMWYSDGNNSVTYYDNGTFKASWSGTNEYDLYVGIRSGSVNKNKQYDAYYKYERTGSAMYGNMGILGWTEDPLTECTASRGGVWRLETREQTITLLDLTQHEREIAVNGVSLHLEAGAQTELRCPALIPPEKAKWMSDDCLEEPDMVMSDRSTPY